MTSLLLLVANYISFYAWPNRNDRATLFDWMRSFFFFFCQRANGDEESGGRYLTCAEAAGHGSLHNQERSKGWGNALLPLLSSSCLSGRMQRPSIPLSFALAAILLDGYVPIQRRHRPIEAAGEGGGRPMYAEMRQIPCGKHPLMCFLIGKENIKTNLAGILWMRRFFSSPHLLFMMSFTWAD